MLDALTLLLDKLLLLPHPRLSALLLPPSSPPAAPPASSDPLPLQFLRGDLLEVPRTLFTHFGIYLGGGRVAHLIPDVLPLLRADSRRVQRTVTNTRLLLGVITKQASVRVDSVEDFAFGAKIVRNAMDRAAALRALPAEEVAQRAERRLGAVCYSLLWNNCEHFVTHCRYGSAHSRQTQQFCDWLKSWVEDWRGVALLSVASLGVSCVSSPPSLLLLLLLLPSFLWMSS